MKLKMHRATDGYYVHYEDDIGESCLTKVCRDLVEPGETVFATLTVDEPEQPKPHVKARFMLVEPGNAVLYQVLEQEGIDPVWNNSASIAQDTPMCVRSAAFPDISEGTILLRGDTTGLDLRVTMRKFDTQELARETVQKAIATLRILNCAQVYTVDNPAPCKECGRPMTVLEDDEYTYNAFRGWCSNLNHTADVKWVKTRELAIADWNKANAPTPVDWRDIDVPTNVWIEEG